MGWEQPPATTDTCAFGNEQAKVIADSIVSKVVLSGLGASLARATMSVLHTVAQSAAIDGYVAGYNRAAFEITQGGLPTPIEAKVPDKSADLR